MININMYYVAYYCILLYLYGLHTIVCYCKILQNIAYYYICSKTVQKPPVNKSPINMCAKTPGKYKHLLAGGAQGCPPPINHNVLNMVSYSEVGIALCQSTVI